MKASQGVASATGMTMLLVLLVISSCGGGNKASQEPMAADSHAQQVPPQMSIEDKSLGLDKNDVFATPDPIVAAMAGGEPGDNQTVAAYFEGAPPAIPHLIEDLLPIRVGDNQCLECHDDPSMIGQSVAEGDPTPIPATHYTDLRHAPDEVNVSLIGARFVCVQCHAPQHDAEPLVGNTYRQ